MELFSKTIILILVFLASCSAPEYQTVKTEVIYKKDMAIRYQGKEFVGMAVLSSAPSYDLHIVAKGELDLFTFTNCHREEVSENAWNVTETKRTFIFKRTVDKKKELKLTYKPTSLEQSFCPVFVAGYEEQKGRHSWGFLDFEDEAHKLQAAVECNGETTISTGVSVCQSKTGLFQRIQFGNKVRLSPDPQCDIGKTEGEVFEFEIKRGQCVYVFMSEGGDLHRLTTFGYDQVLIRKE